MRVSLNQIKQYIDFELPLVGELVAQINQQLGGVEEVLDLNAVYKDAVIVKVVKCDKHPNADKLSVCKVDDGGTVKDANRDKDGLVEVVCGAPNVHADMLAVWLPPSSVVPATYHDNEPFVLGARELRGVVSQGMLASPKELGLGDSHDGILELDPGEWKPNNVEVKPGVSFAEAYALNDTIIDIENKMFTHRPDLFGQLGVAREIAGIGGKEFTDPEWYWKVPQFDNADGLELEVFNDAKSNVPRFMAVAMKNVEVKPSPIWLQCALVAMGSKPINNVVDVTNYVMLLTAQPTHAYDYDKLGSHKLGARMAKEGESAQLLNGKTYQLDEDDIVIVDGQGIVGLGGIMGGGNSEVSLETKNIVLEVANFDMYAVRKSSMRHGLFTDALTRFNKGQSRLQNDRVLNLLMMTMKDVSGAEQASNVADLHETAAEYDAQSLSGTIKVEERFINERLGLSLSGEDIQTLLRNVHFACYVDEGETAISITAPFWRTDIEQPEDIVEEVGRLYGFDKLPRELPQRSITPPTPNQLQQSKAATRSTLTRAGANEILTYSFVHEKLLQRVGQDKSHAYKLSNALSPDLQYYRLSLTPSLLDKVHMNIKAGHGQFSLFEQNKVHYKGEMDEAEPDVPNEDNHVALVVAYGDKTSPTGAPYFHATNYLASIVDLASHKLVRLADFDLAKDEWGTQLTAPYEPTRSAVIVKDNQIWGVVGEFTAAVKKAFKLPQFAAGFEVHTDITKTGEHDYSPLSKFPSVTQDISLISPKETSYESVDEVVRTVLGELEESLKAVYQPISIYQADDGSTKTTTFRISVSSMERTLTEAEVTKIVESVATRAKREINATV